MPLLALFERRLKSWIARCEITFFQNQISDEDQRPCLPGSATCRFLKLYLGQLGLAVHPQQLAEGSGDTASHRRAPFEVSELSRDRKVQLPLIENDRDPVHDRGISELLTLDPQQCRLEQRQHEARDRPPRPSSPVQSRSSSERRGTSTNQIGPRPANSGSNRRPPEYPRIGRFEKSSSQLAGVLHQTAQIAEGHRQNHQKNASASEMINHTKNRALIVPRVGSYRRELTSRRNTLLAAATLVPVPVPPGLQEVAGWKIGIESFAA